MLKTRVFYKTDVRDLFHDEFFRRLPKITDSDDEATRRKKEERLKEIKAFQIRNGRSKSVKYGAIDPAKMWIREDNLSELLGLLDMTYKDLFEAITLTTYDLPKNPDPEKEALKKKKSLRFLVEEARALEPFVLEWPDKLDDKMCELCDSLTEEQRAAVYDFVTTLIPQSLSDQAGLDGETKTVLMMCYRQSTAAEIIRLSEWVKDVDMRRRIRIQFGILNGRDVTKTMAKEWHEKKYRQNEDSEDEDDGRIGEEYFKAYNLFDISILPYICYQFGISLHMALDLDENTTILAKHGTTEKIMDIFSMLDVRYEPRWNVPTIKGHEDEIEEGAVEKELNRKFFAYETVKKAFLPKEGGNV